MTASDLGRQVGQKIAELRKALLLTQEELAERSGISVSFVSMIERADRLPHVQTLAAIADALGVALPELFVGVDRPRPSHPSPSEIPLIAYLRNLQLDSHDVELLLSIAKAMVAVHRLPPSR